MNCPTCHQAMKKIRWSITDNKEVADKYKEYDSTTYHCEADDAWVNVEVPAETKN